MSLCEWQTAGHQVPCPSLSPGACSDPCPLSRWCYPTSSSCRPLLFFSSIFPSIRVFFSESAPHIRRPKDWSFSFSVSPSNEYSGLISFNIGWLDLLLSKELSRVFYSTYSKASVLGCGSAFFTVQLLHLYITSGKNKGLPMQTFVSKVMSLQASFNFMAAIIICSDFGAQENKMSLFPLFPHLFAMNWWDHMPWS